MLSESGGNQTKILLMHSHNLLDHYIMLQTIPRYANTYTYYNTYHMDFFLSPGQYKQNPRPFLDTMSSLESHKSVKGVVLMPIKSCYIPFYFSSVK